MPLYYPPEKKRIRATTLNLRWLFHCHNEYQRYFFSHNKVQQTPLIKSRLPIYAFITAVSSSPLFGIGMMFTSRCAYRNQPTSYGTCTKTIYEAIPYLMAHPLYSRSDHWHFWAWFVHSRLISHHACAWEVRTGGRETWARTHRSVTEIITG